jgi:hypothetical protein
MAGNSKQVIKPYKVISAGDMSQSSLTSAVSNIQGVDNIAYQVNFSGSPVGTFDVQVSMDFQPGVSPNSAPANSGTLISLPLSSPVAASGSAGAAYLDLNQVSAPFIRIVYTKTSGTGSLDALIVAKSI